jgi:hypothetical protein
MRALALLLLWTCAASAQGVEAFAGLYGSASDPATSCAANPHRIDFIAQPPHAFLTWQTPWIDAQGAEITMRRFDLEAIEGRKLTLREEGGARLADGARPTWVLRLTTAPAGYCWGRADWPVVRCEDQQVLCSAPTS